MIELYAESMPAPWSCSTLQEPVPSLKFYFPSFSYLYNTLSWLLTHKGIREQVDPVLGWFLALV